MNYKIENIKKSDLGEIGDLISISFKHVKEMNSDGLSELFKYAGVTENSLKVVLGNKIIGYHFLNEVGCMDIENESFKYTKDINWTIGKKGVEGEILCVHPDYQKKGIASNLMKYEENIFKEKYDYITGGFHTFLNNYNFWVKHREIVGKHINKKGETISFKTIKKLK